MDVAKFNHLLSPCRTSNFPKIWRTVSRAEKLARRDRESHQRSLLCWIRPHTWCTVDLFAECLVDDARGVIVQHLLSLRDAASVKAFALVSRACALTVHQVLEAIRLNLLRVLASEPCYTDMMNTFGIRIPRDRVIELMWARRTTWVHRASSVLAHVSGSCELCGAPMGSRPRREGPVSLHACSECTKKHRVRFIVGLAIPEGFTKIEEVLDANAHCVKIKLFDVWGGRSSQAWILARHMLSRKTQYRKKMLRKRGDISATVQREKHEIEMTEPLRRFLSLVPRERFFRGTWQWHQSRDPEILKLHVEAWLQLPREIPQDLTFSALMGITETEELMQSAQAAVERKEAKDDERTITLASFRKLYKEAKDSRLDAASVVSSSYFGATQLVDLCFAADSLIIRALANREVFGSLTAMRDVVKLSRDTREDAVARLGLAARVLRSFLTSRDALEDTPRREFCLVVIKRAGAALFHNYHDAEARMREIVDVCEKSRVKARLASKKGDKMHLTFYAPLPDGKTRRIAMTCNVYSQWQTSKLIKQIATHPDGARRLTASMLKTLERLANFKMDRCSKNVTLYKARAEARACIVQLATSSGWKDAIEQFRGASTDYDR